MLKTIFLRQPNWNILLDNELKVIEMVFVRWTSLEWCVVSITDITIPKVFNLSVNWGYTCPTDKESNAKLAEIFCDHLKKTHLLLDSIDMPRNHTIIIKGDLRTTAEKNASRRNITSTLRQCISTICGDDNTKYGLHKHADPILYLYTGIRLICVMSNEKIEEKPPQGNVTSCWLISVKIKERTYSYKCKNVYDKRVWSVNAWIVNSGAGSKLQRHFFDSKTNQIHYTEGYQEPFQNTIHSNLERFVNSKK